MAESEKHGPKIVCYGLAVRMLNLPPLSCSVSFSGISFHNFLSSWSQGTFLQYTVRQRMPCLLGIQDFAPNEAEGHDVLFRLALALSSSNLLASPKINILSKASCFPGKVDVIDECHC